MYHFACVWPTALKLGCITNFDMLFLVMGFISLVDEIQFMLIFSSHHICIRPATRSFYLADFSSGKSTQKERIHGDTREKVRSSIRKL